jgi:hypothetical protein
MMNPGGPVMPDLSKAELVDFTVEGNEPRVRLKLADGAVIELKIEVTGVLHVGNDPNTGYPMYNVQIATVMRPVSIPKELRKAPLRPGASRTGKNDPGVS